MPKRFIVADVATADEQSDSGSTLEYTPLNDSMSEGDDEVYGLGPGRFPTCKTCGAEMTGLDGWAWYICPFCEDKVRIIEGKETWYNEIFGRGKNSITPTTKLPIAVRVEIYLKSKKCSPAAGLPAAGFLLISLLSKTPSTQ